jgi:hypothetical protein
MIGDGLAEDARTRIPFSGRLTVMAVCFCGMLLGPKPEATIG